VKRIDLAEELEMGEHVVGGAGHPIELVRLLTLLVFAPVPQVCDAGLMGDGPPPNSFTNLYTIRRLWKPETALEIVETL